MKHAILLTHGPIGDALIEATRGIMGIENGLHALSVTNMSVSEISQRLLSLVDAPEERAEGVVIMASLKGGSCWNVAVAIAKDHPHVKVISGVNLPMVLTFMTKRDNTSLEKLAEYLEEDSIRSIVKFEISAKK